MTDNKNEAYWEPLAASLLVSILIGVPGLVILWYGTKMPRKHHMLNVFSSLFFALFATAFAMRCFYWVVWAWPGKAKDSSDIGVPIGVRAFLITYPQMNILICGFLVQYPWLYDFILIQNGRNINLVLRQQMKMFVVAANIFTVLMYLVYAFSFPINDDKY